jgi:predicted DNA-binding ribbon-helix-helix protein
METFATMSYFDGAPTLVSRNVTVGARRTSVRLEPAMWDAITEICRREQRNIHDLCTAIDRTRDCSSLTAAIRVFVVHYFRAAATEEGHQRAGHGNHERRTFQRPIGAYAAESGVRLAV